MVGQLLLSLQSTGEFLVAFHIEWILRTLREEIRATAIVDKCSCFVPEVQEKIDITACICILTAK